MTMEDFIERVKLSKEPFEYDNPYDYKLGLAKQMELKTGQVGTKDTQLSYVITTKQLPIPELAPYYRDGGKKYTFIKWVNSKDELDYDHYRELVLKTLLKFNIRPYVQTNLFGEEFEMSNVQRVRPLNKVPDDEL
jgi:hypothetical protein